MDDLQSEKEQIEELRQWWSENGRYVIGGIVIGASLLLGWNKFKSNKLEAQIQASALFEELANEVADGDLDNAERIADQLSQDFGNTPYAAQSKLAMARLYTDKNRDQDAADVLSQLLGMSDYDELKDVGRLRLAKIMLYQDRAQDAIDLLEDQKNTAFAPLYAEALGDAHALLGNISRAEDAYRAALDASAQGTIDRSIVQMKLIDLPDETAVSIENTGDTDGASEENVADSATAETVSDVEAGSETGTKSETEDR